MRRAVFVIFPLILAGCGLPPAVTIASYALQGISFLSTGKSVADHALSVVAQRDCAMLRMVQDEPVCREYRNGERGALLAFADAWKNRSPGINSDDPDPEGGPAEIDWRDNRPAVQVAAADPVLIPGAMSHLLPALDGVARVAPTLRADAAGFSGRPLTGWSLADGAANGTVENGNDLILPIPRALRWKPVVEFEPLPVVAAPKPVAVTGRRIGATVLIVGSFRKKINARRAAGSLRSLRPVVVPVRIAEQTFYRVVAGPFAPAAMERRRGALQSAGVMGVWSARLCVPGLENPGCVSLP